MRLKQQYVSLEFVLALGRRIVSPKAAIDIVFFVQYFPPGIVTSAFLVVITSG